MHNMIKLFLLVLIVCGHSGLVAAELDSKANTDFTIKNREPAFELVVLGDAGGSKDGNLSAFLLRALTDNQYIGLDAGTLLNGIDIAVQHNAFVGLNMAEEQPLTPSMTILHQHITGYLISHAHLDHIAGLVIASPDDKAKPIYALASVNQAISNFYFNWQAWPNFADRGQAPQLKKYKLVDLALSKTHKVTNTSLQVTAFSLSHPVESTAFVIESDNDIMVYFGDTGPDEVEQNNKLETVWRYLAQQTKHKNLRGIVIEASFPDNQADKDLYGHLTPKWLTKELSHFSTMLDNPTKLAAAKIIVSHVKLSTLKDVDASAVIYNQLQQHNKLGLQFIMAKQGHKILL